MSDVPKAESEEEMKKEENALIYFKDLRERKVKDYSSIFDIAPKDSLVYQVASAEIEIYDTVIRVLEQDLAKIVCPHCAACNMSENPTNGDMIKALFPKAKFDNAMPFTDGRWETMNLDTENLVRATHKPTQLRTYADWWNARYTEETR